MRASGGHAACLATIATMLLAGCADSVVPLDEEAGVDGADVPLVLRPWLTNWALSERNFTVDYDPEAKHVVAEGTLVIRNLAPEPLPEFSFTLDRFTVTRLQDEEGNDLEVEAPLAGQASPVDVATGTFVVAMTGDVAPGATRTLAIAYEGWANEDRSVPGLPNDFGMTLHRLLLPRAADAPREMTRLAITYPATWIVTASGDLLSRSEDGGRVTDRYELPYNNMVVSGLKGAESHASTIDGIDVRTYFFPDMREQGRLVHEVTERMLRVLPPYLGPFPFNHLWTIPSQVQANAFSTPGVTHLGLNFYRFSIREVPVQFGRLIPYVGGGDSFETVIVHEHVHNWWGHNVRGNTLPDGPNEQWVSEGVTTYLSELLWLQLMHGEEDAAASARGKSLDQAPRNGVSGERPITDGGDSYEKTALALRALEAYAKVTGRPGAVLEALALAQERFGRIYGGEGRATSREMFAVFDEVFAENLSWHFEPWFFGTGISDLSIKSVSRSGGNLTVTVANTGDVRAAALLSVVSATGNAFTGGGVVDAGNETAIAIALPPGMTEPIVRAVVDPLQYVYERSEADNAWVGNA